MTFAAPIWLALLLPWAALTLWLIRARSKSQPVPFIELWRGSMAAPKTSQLFHPPPLALLGALLALLFAILATAQPALRLPLPLDERAATVILDRGVTMSSPARRDDVTAQANAALVRLGVTEVNLINLPGGGRITTSANRWSQSVA